jgi:ATP-binding cassette, subfamily B, bacterial PglK
MLGIIRKILILLSHEERHQVYRLFVAIVFLGLIETVGVASIMPFIAVVAKPDVVYSNKWLKLTYDTLNFTSIPSFLVFLCVLVLGILVISNGFKAMTTRAMLRFTFMRNHSLARQLLVRYLNQPYAFYLNQNTAELGKNILVEVGSVVNGIINPFIEVISSSIVVIFIFSLLLIVNPLLAVTVALVLGGAYSGIYIWVRRKLYKIGKLRVEANKMRFKIITETLNGIKELKVLGRESDFLRRFAVHSKKFAEHQSTSQIINRLPRFALEVVAFGGILLIVLYYLIFNVNTSHLLPLVALYALAGYRLMPSLQLIFSETALIRFNIPALDILYKDLTCESNKRSIELTKEYNIERLPLRRYFMMERVDFAYPNTKEQVIKEFSLTIEAKRTVGFVGSTGSGKTTIADIIIGLLSPDDGKIIVDGVVIENENLIRWQKNIGYVPQNIYLSDDTVTKNIAFGVSDKNINNQAVLDSAKIANLHDFVVSELPQGYETIIGERGIRLSGGQRQRIGIARALYHDPDVLLLDEATSALDGITEDAVMEAIQNLSHKKTIIMIAHRLTTVKNCDVIYVMENGEIIAQGTYEELMQSCSPFRNMAKAMV